jgi:hypothetical protein
MIQRLASLLGGTDKYSQIVKHLLLAGKTVKPLRSQGSFHLALLAGLAVSRSV